MIVDGVKVNFVGIDDATREEAANYVTYVRGRVNEPIKTINVKLCDDGLVDVESPVKRLPSAVKPHEDDGLSARY